jgi:hypothetical protein
MKQNLKFTLVTGALLFSIFSSSAQVPIGAPPPFATTPACVTPIVNQTWIRGAIIYLNKNIFVSDLNNISAELFFYALVHLK